jgi:hypothetical protein
MLPGHGSCPGKSNPTLISLPSIFVNGMVSAEVNKILKVSPVAVHPARLAATPICVRYLLSVPSWAKILATLLPDPNAGNCRKSVIVGKVSPPNCIHSKSSQPPALSAPKAVSSAGLRAIVQRSAYGRRKQTVSKCQIPCVGSVIIGAFGAVLISTIEDI